MSERPRLSIVIPAYNEQQRLPASLERLHQYLDLQGYSYEVLVVDNDSRDDTVGVVQRAAAR